MTVQDVFQTLEHVDDATADVLAERLEMRGGDDAFVALRDTYLDRLELHSATKVLDLGCGTGVVTRAVAARPDFAGRVVGSDYSAALIERACRLATAEGVADQTTFVVEDAREIRSADQEFDAVVLHTLVSHVPTPDAVIAEAARVTRVGGPVVVFDGDYASLVLHTGSADDRLITDAILGAVVANPTVMRQMPAMLDAAGLDVSSVDAAVRIEVGELSFFRSLVDAYLPMAVAGGLVDAARAAAWSAALDESVVSGGAFASCNYVTYIAERT